MVEVKIACQCGVPFRYGLELVDGRAPEGVGCPTCNAPITPACSTLVDFLTGKTPNPLPDGTRVLKDIKVLCACGARYKFELELAESTMPTQVICPACQAELTELANEELRKFPARFTADLPAAQSPPSEVAQLTSSSAAPTDTPPASSAPAVSPVPVVAEAPVKPAAIQPPSAPVAVAPGAEPAAAPTFAPLFPPFDAPSSPPPKGMPNLKPLEVPRMERPVRPAGTSPGSPAAAKPPAAAAATHSSAKPAAKVEPKAAAAKPVVKAAGPRALNLPLGAAGACGGALLGAGAWFAVLQFTTLGGGWMALLVGGLAGFGARLLGRGTSQALGGIACIATVVAIGVMTWITLAHQVNRLAQPFLKGRYQSIKAEAKEVSDAKSDVDLKRLVARSVPTADPSMIVVTEADMQTFREKRLPYLRDIASGKISQSQFESQELAKYRSNYPLDEAWDQALGIVGLLCALGGIIGAAKIAFKAT